MFGDWPFEKAFAFASNCGYTGVEFAPFTMATYVDKISRRPPGRSAAAGPRAGLEVVGLHWLLGKTEGFHLTSPDAAVRRKTADYLGELARLCGDLGGRIMVLGSPQQRNLAPGMTKQQGMKYAAEVLQAVAPTLEKNRVIIAIEPLGPTRPTSSPPPPKGPNWSPWSIRPPAACISTARRWPTESGKRTGPISRNGPQGASQNHLPRRHSRDHPQVPQPFVHFHANDPNHQGPGFGKLDFVPIMKALAEIDYRGWVSVEPTDYSAGPERLAQESIAYLRKCAAKSVRNQWTESRGRQSTAPRCLGRREGRGRLRCRPFLGDRRRHSCSTQKPAQVVGWLRP